MIVGKANQFVGVEYPACQTLVYRKVRDHKIIETTIQERPQSNISLLNGVNMEEIARTPLAYAV
jgi:hypothetical protein